MFVVKRPFRDQNGFHATGSIVEPGSIGRFKSRVGHGNIIEVTEHNFEKVAKFFLNRFGIVLCETAANADTDIDTDVDTDVDTNATVDPVPETTKVDVKTTVKVTQKIEAK